MHGQQPVLHILMPKPKDILYGELTTGQRSICCLQLRYEDVGKRDTKVLGIHIYSWEDLAANRTSLRSTLQKQLWIGKERFSATAAEKQAHRKKTMANRPESMHRCDLCD